RKNGIRQKSAKPSDGTGRVEPPPRAERGEDQPREPLPRAYHPIRHCTRAPVTAYVGSHPSTKGEGAIGRPPCREAKCPNCLNRRKQDAGDGLRCAFETSRAETWYKYQFAESSWDTDKKRLSEAVRRGRDDQGEEGVYFGLVNAGPDGNERTVW